MQLNSLPVELLQLIFADADDSWRSLREVCRKFFEIVNPMIWQEVALDTTVQTFSNKLRFWLLSKSNVLFEPERLMNFVDPVKDLVHRVELTNRDFDYGLSTEMQYYLLTLPNLQSIKIYSTDAMFTEPEGHYFLKKLEDGAISAAQLEFQIFLKRRIDPVDYRDIVDGITRLRNLGNVSELGIYTTLMSVPLTQHFREFLGKISPPVTVLSVHTADDESMDSVRDLFRRLHLSSSLKLELTCVVSNDAVKCLTLSDSIKHLSLLKLWPPVDDVLTIEGSNIHHITTSIRTLNMCRLNMPKLNSLTINVDSVAVPTMLINIAEACCGMLDKLSLILEDYSNLDSVHPLVQLVDKKLFIKSYEASSPFGVSKTRRFMASCMRLLNREYRFRELELDYLQLESKDLALFLLEATKHLKNLEKVQVVAPLGRESLNHYDIFAQFYRTNLHYYHTSGETDDFERDLRIAWYEGYRDCFIKVVDEIMQADMPLIRDRAELRGESMDPYLVSESFAGANLVQMFS
ncbi:hypothetical protein TRVA0_018S02740 [Trichomonascus vanleenenianus]|uniref:F-box protein n=1 Tax=Trichomonascus vanleenenianus TaxID=2268995 RepID=UPI003ECB85C1